MSAFDWKKARVPGSTLIDLDGMPVVLSPDGLSAFTARNGTPVVVGRIMRDGGVISEHEFEVLLAKPRDTESGR